VYFHFSTPQSIALFQFSLKPVLGISISLVAQRGEINSTTFVSDGDYSNNNGVHIKSKNNRIHSKLKNVRMRKNVRSYHRSQVA